MRIGSTTCHCKGIAMDKIKERLAALVDGAPYQANPRDGVTELASILLELVNLTGPAPAKDPAAPDA